MWGCILEHMVPFQKLHHSRQLSRRRQGGRESMHGYLSRPPFLWRFSHACHCCKCPYCKQESAKLWCSLLPSGRVNSFSYLVISQTQVICLIHKFDLANIGALQGVIKFYCKQNTFSFPLIIRTITDVGFLLMTGGVNPERILRRPLATFRWQGWTMVYI